MFQTTIDKPKVCIITVPTEKRAGTIKTALHDLGVRFVWVDRCEVLHGYGLFTLPEDSGRAYDLYLQWRKSGN
jgi:hypothetical protein